jgi:hypothetical protein
LVYYKFHWKWLSWYSHYVCFFHILFHSIACSSFSYIIYLLSNHQYKFNTCTKTRQLGLYKSSITLYSIIYSTFTMNDNVAHAASQSVNYNYTVFVPYLESFCNSVRMIVCHKYGCCWWICDTMLWMAYKHSGICCMKSESLALPFANKQHAHRLQCTDLQCWMLLLDRVKLDLWSKWKGMDGVDGNIACWCYDLSLWDGCSNIPTQHCPSDQRSDPLLLLCLTAIPIGNTVSSNMVLSWHCDVTQLWYCA